MPKNRQDSTLRNVQAANKKIVQLQKKVKDLEFIAKVYSKELRFLYKKLDTHEKAIARVIIVQEGNRR